MNKWRDEAENGDAETQSALGYHYLTEGDTDEAWKWQCRAAQQNYAHAQWYLAETYSGLSWEYGTPVARDYPRAFMWYSLAATNGHNRAGEVAEELKRTLTPEQIAEGRRLLKAWRPDPLACG